MPPPIAPTHIRIVVGGLYGVHDSSRFEAVVSLAGGGVQIVRNGIVEAHAQVEKKREEERVAAAAKQKQIEETLAKLKAAVSECGPNPKVTGGPWFSSTYKQAVLDNASRLALSSAQIQREISRLTAVPDPNVFKQLQNQANDIGFGLDLMDKRFLCVKEIKYVGAAVNPFGGNAARAVFAGYGRDFNILNLSSDFPY
jgi:hypothetical protein